MNITPIVHLRLDDDTLLPVCGAHCLAGQDIISRDVTAVTCADCAATILPDHASWCASQPQDCNCGAPAVRATEPKSFIRVDEPAQCSRCGMSTDRDGLCTACCIDLIHDRRTSTQPKSFDWSRGNTDDYSVRIASFNRFEIKFREDDAASASHQGPCEEDVADLLCARYIKAQFDAIDPNNIRAELAEYGAWDENELADNAQNRVRILWIAAGIVVEGR